jgi:hypothetical protein
VGLGRGTRPAGLIAVALLAATATSGCGGSTHSIGFRAVEAVRAQWGPCLEAAGINPNQPITGTGDGQVILLTFTSGDRFRVAQTGNPPIEAATPVNDVTRQHIALGAQHRPDCHH